MLRILGPLFALALAIELCIAMLGSALKGINSQGRAVRPRVRDPGSIGKLFLTKYLFPFEVASLLLLVAAIGAVVLARRRRGLEPTTETERQIGLPRPSYTGTMAEAGGIRLPLRRRAARARRRAGRDERRRALRSGGRLVMAIGWYLASRRSSSASAPAACSCAATRS